MNLLRIPEQIRVLFAIGCLAIKPIVLSFSVLTRRELIVFVDPYNLFGISMIFLTIGIVTSGLRVFSHGIISWW